MHIVHLLPELHQGGVETIVLSLNRELVKRGHQSTVISNGGSLADQIKKDGGRHITLEVCSKNPLSVPFRVSTLRSLLSDLRPSVVHAHSRVPAWLVWFANKRLHLPWVTTVHGFNSVSKYSAIMTKGDRVICVSNPVKEYIQQNYPVDKSKISVIHCGIAMEQFNPETVDHQQIESLKSEFNLHGKFVATSIGRITELKDYETFIRAISMACEANPNIRGLIVGHIREDKQDYYDRLQQLVVELRMQDHIHFATHCTSMPELYALSDVVVSCSKKPESFGLTLIEALAMNTPVIATRHGGPLDIIREGENGFLFEPQHPEELAQKLCSEIHLQCTDLRADTLERFGLDRMVDETLETYKKAL
ncbi:MAG: glycosyl transferase [Verrucomicrobia bacterium]|nr:MAG: glycosyl transferase [Verrucomicrobiota bacterium]